MLEKRTRTAWGIWARRVDTSRRNCEGIIAWKVSGAAVGGRGHQST